LAFSLLKIIIKKIEQVRKKKNVIIGKRKLGEKRGTEQTEESE